VIDYPDGRLSIRYNGIDLAYRTFDKRPQVNQAAIVENKRLGPILAYIAEQQKKLDMSRSARRRGDEVRKTICSRLASIGTRVARCATHGSARRPLETQNSTPNPKKGG
jgi:hypothetical protein